MPLTSKFQLFFTNPPSLQNPSIKAKIMSASSLLRPLRRHFSTSPSSILNPSNPTSILTSKQKSLSALSLLKSLKSNSNSSNLNPNSILSICRAAALSPSFSSIDRSAISLAVSLLSSSPSSVRSLLSDLPNDDPSRKILLFGHAGLISDSLATFKSNPSTKTLNSLLLASIVARDYGSAEKFYKELPKEYNLTPDLMTYNTLVKSFSESGSTRSVYSVLDEMHQRKVRPNATTFTNAISGFYREERLDEVAKVLELMKKRYGLNPVSLAVYNARIEGLCKLKRAKEAKELFGEMKRKKMKGNWVTYDKLIVGFCKEGDLEEAKRLYGEMRTRKGLEAESGCYFKLVYHLCEGGDFEGALGVCRDAMEKNWVPCFKTMKVLVNGLVKVGKVEEAKEIVGKMKERFPNQADSWKEVEESLPQ